MLVKIKTWETMLDEYGLTEEGSIGCEYCFTKSMEADMPTDRILDVTNEKAVIGGNTCKISSDMISYYLSEKDEWLYAVKNKDCIVDPKRVMDFEHDLYVDLDTCKIVRSTDGYKINDILPLKYIAFIKSSDWTSEDRSFLNENLLGLKLHLSLTDKQAKRKYMYFTGTSFFPHRNQDISNLYIMTFRNFYNANRQSFGIFEEGDKVFLKPDLVIGQRYGDIYFSNSAYSYKDILMVVHKIDDTGLILTKSNSLLYTHEMLVPRLRIEDIEEGATYNIRKGLKYGESYGGIIFRKSMNKESITVNSVGLDIASNGFTYNVEMLSVKVKSFSEPNRARWMI